MSSSNYSVLNPPGVSVSDDYRSLYLFRKRALKEESDAPDNFDWYDICVQQRIPFVVT
jgi:hypothetical protein